MQITPSLGTPPKNFIGKPFGSYLRGLLYYRHQHQQLSPRLGSWLPGATSDSGAPQMALFHRLVLSAYMVQRISGQSALKRTLYKNFRLRLLIFVFQGMDNWTISLSAVETLILSSSTWTSGCHRAHIRDAAGCLPAAALGSPRVTSLTPPRVQHQ